MYDQPLFLAPDPLKHPEYAWPRAVYDGRITYQKGLCPQAERALGSHISISSSEFYTETEVCGIAEALRKVALAFSTEDV